MHPLITMLFDSIFFQPLDREVARGLITEYCLEYINQSHTVRQLFPASSSDRLNKFGVSDLRSDVNYTFVLTARNRKGYNESLHGNRILVSTTSGKQFC
jgi:hypothetical protein